MISVSQAKLSEIDEIFKLGSQVNEFQVSSEVVTFWPKKILRRIINSPTDFLLIAKDRTQIIGLIIANYNPNFSKAIIENLFVSPQFRGQKIADLLRDNLITKLKNLKCEYLCTLIESNSQFAINSYLHYGFKKGINCLWLDLIIDKSFSRNS